jgi:arabinose-5-phosphate isomerase
MAHMISGRLDRSRLLSVAGKIIETEAAAVASLGTRLNDDFVRAVEILLGCTGKVIVCGIGKSGHIGRKIAATMASTGTPAFFVHPAEALHGDLGVVTGHDVVLALSQSGESGELLSLLSPLKRLGAKLIAITGNGRSTLGREADVVLDSSVAREACPLGLAPSASTTATLALGDALALTLLDARGFSTEDFARSHPAGTLGRKLLVRVRDVMHQGEGLPAVLDDATLTEALLEMSRKRLGMTAVLTPDGKLAGILTDGDLRRSLEKGLDIRVLSVTHVMTRSPHTIDPDRLASEAVKYMEQFRINGLLCLSPDRAVVGALNMHDLLRAGVI